MFQITARHEIQVMPHLTPAGQAFSAPQEEDESASARILRPARGSSRRPRRFRALASMADAHVESPPRHHFSATARQSLPPRVTRRAGDSLGAQVRARSMRMAHAALGEASLGRFWRFTAHRRVRGFRVGACQRSSIGRDVDVSERDDAATATIVDRPGRPVPQCRRLVAFGGERRGRK